MRDKHRILIKSPALQELMTSTCIHACVNTYVPTDGISKITFSMHVKIVSRIEGKEVETKYRLYRCLMHSPQRHGGTSVGHAGRITLRRQQCDMTHKLGGGQAYDRSSD
jgi:hypothetical protein